MPLILVTGTGTEVGKTYVTAALMRRLREQNGEVHARKPVQSYAPDDSTTDAFHLSKATGEAMNDVCPPHRRYPLAMAPPMAAEVLRMPPFTIAQLVDELHVSISGFTFIESVGGVRSPLAYDGDTVTLADEIAPDTILLVAQPGLGAINLVRLSVDAFAGKHRVIVYLNRYDADDEMHRRNAMWLRTREDLDVDTDIEALASRLYADY